MNIGEKAIHQVLIWMKAGKMEKRGGVEVGEDGLKVK